MSGNANQKTKILYLMKILMEETDELHPLTIKELVTKLDQYNIQAERKSLYNDIENLRSFGIDIEKNTARACAYYVASRSFELPELKLLVDAVQSSKFITHKKSTELIHKIGQLTSVYEARQLKRQVYMTNRIKTVNECIYYNVDYIHNAIAQDKQITFQYFEWVVDFQQPEKVRKQFRKNGEFYCVSPWALFWDDEKYYLVAFDSATNQIKHYRVDKMSSIALLEHPRQGKECFQQFDLAVYSQKVFGMYGGKEEKVTLKLKNSLVGVMLDKFGNHISISKCDEEHIYVRLKVAVSPPFIGWLVGFGNQVTVVEPSSLAETVRKTLTEIINAYEIS